MLDIGRFVSDGVGLKITSAIKGMQSVWNEVEGSSAAMPIKLVDPAFSICIGSSGLTLQQGFGTIAADGLSVTKSCDTYGKVSAWVIEFEPSFIKSIQKGSSSSFVTSHTNLAIGAAITINEVIPANCLALVTGYTARYDNDIAAVSWETALLPTSVRFRKSGSDVYDTPVTANWIVIEFVEGVMRV